VSSADKGESSARRDQILATAARIFAERGVMRTSIRDIAMACGILSGSLYHHFASKDEIVDSIVSASWQDLITSIEAVLARETDPADVVRELIRVNLGVAMRNRDAVRIIQQDWHYLAESFAHVVAYRATIDGIWVDSIRKAVDSGAFHAGLDPVIVYHSILGSLNWIHTWYRADGKLSPDEIAEVQVDIFFHGLVASG
jgi:AcrR family transcriptional regulator